MVWSKEKNISVPTEKRGLGMVFQTYAIWPHMNVFDNVAYPLQIRNVPRDVIRQRVAKTLGFVHLEGMEKRPATKLSGGQQQRVALARALVAEPKVILFDEPLSNLDAKLREETRKELRTFLGKLKITAVYVTHDRVEALALSDTIAVMRDGRIVEIGRRRRRSISTRTTASSRTSSAAPTWSRPRCGPQEGGPHHRRLRTGDHRLPAARHPRRQRGHAVHPAGVHPHRRGARAGGENVVNGRVESLVFVGEAYEAEIRVGDELLLAKIDPDADLKEGDAVNFRLDPAHCLLVSI